MFKPAKKYRAAIVGATGMVGQRLITLLDNHPYFEISILAASKRSANRTYAEALDGRWKMAVELPSKYASMNVYDSTDFEAIKNGADIVFCAVNMDKAEIVKLEEAYAKNELVVVSNNSANRWTKDVPMIIPEINTSHLALIPYQKKRLGTKRGFIITKPNCSIQSYVPLLTPLLKYHPTEVVATTYQAISGAGKTFREWPEMVDNVIPYIGGEEDKSENEPLRIWGEEKNGEIIPASKPVITTQCIRVPVTNGHLAAIFMSFENKPSKEEILKAWNEYEGEPQKLGLPSAPEKFITYFEEDNRPQTGVDRDIYGGMGITAGRLREDKLYDYKLVGLSHNTLRGAAGGSVLTAELLAAKGLLD